MLTWLKQTPIAHRGYHNSEIVENTLEAFENAIKHNYNIELDLQLSKDGQIVIMHDLNLKRLTGINKKVHDLNYDELKQIKLGKNEQHIPLFKDVLSLVDGKINLVIELKNINYRLNKKLVDKTLEILNDYKGVFVLQSFNPFIVKRIRKLRPDLPRGQLVGEYKGIPFPMNYLMKHMYTNIFSKPQFIDMGINLNVKQINKYIGKIPVISYTAKNEQDYVKYMNKYDNVIFEGFKPDNIFKQIISQK